MFIISGRIHNFILSLLFNTAKRHLDMILKAIEFTTKVFNQFIKNKFGLDENAVLANNIVDQNGTVPLENQNKIIISIIHIEQETTKQFYGRNQKLPDGNYVNKPLTQRYNLYLLITPNFDNYNETLKFLNASIQFFQANEILDATTNADIPSDLNKLEFELQKGESYMQMQNLWTALGAKYRPSLIYKMKLVTVATEDITGFSTEISQTSNQALQL